MNRFSSARVLRHLDHRCRFRDRLLIGMLLVAILPLGIFGALVASELGAISRNTTNAAHSALIEDQEARQSAAVAERAKVLDVRLGAINGEVRHLRDQMATALAASRPPGPYPDPLASYHGVSFTEAPDSTLIVGATGRQVASAAPPDAASRAAQSGLPGMAMVPFMQATRRTYPEIEAVWIVDKVNAVIRTVPAMDVRGAVDGHRLDPAAPLGTDGEATFSTSLSRFSSAGNSTASWVDPNPAVAAHRSDGGPFWTDPYQTRQAGEEGVTVWMPVGDGQTLIGADITVQQVTDSLLDTTITGEPGAYPLLLSSSNKVLVGAPGAHRDFRLAPPYIGTTLPATGEAKFDEGLNGVEQSGRVQTLPVTLAGTRRDVFTAPIYTARWVLATSVPLGDLEPDVTGLARGVDNGIRGIIAIAAGIALLMCALAFVLATLVARRLVGPIGALTRSAERLAGGDTEHRVPPQGSDEIGQLAESLEHMRQEINVSRNSILDASRGLEHRVAERTAELRNRNDELVALNALARSLTRSLDPEVILQGAIVTIRAVIALDAAVGFTAGPAGDLTAQTGADEPATAEAARLIATVARAAADEGTMVAREVSDGMLVGLPLGTSTGALGALGMLATSRGAVRRRETWLGAVADQVGLALRTAQLSLEGRALAVLEERTRLAREIHDTLAQQLTAIVVQLEAAEGLVERDAERAADVVVTARDQARSALQEARRSVWDLRPASLRATGLVAALQSEVQRWRERTGIAATFRCEGLPVPLTVQPQGEVALLRILQEALENVAKHSGASHVQVRLRHRDGLLEFNVTDDGHGFDPHEDAHDGSFGLTGMEERARLAGAGFTVESTARGTHIQVELPRGTRVAAIA